LLLQLYGFTLMYMNDLPKKVKNMGLYIKVTKCPLSVL
jgi:hypothetical protein